MEQNIISFTSEELLLKALEKKKSTGISINNIEIEKYLKVQGKVSRGINIEFNVICDIEGVTLEEIIIDLKKIKILGLPLSKKMIMKYLESNFKTSAAKFQKGKVLVSKSALIKKIPELKNIIIEDVFILNNLINIKTGEENKYSIG